MKRMTHYKFFEQYGKEICLKRSDGYQTEYYEVPEIRELGASLTSVLFLDDGTIETENFTIESRKLYFANILSGQGQSFTGRSEVSVNYQVENGEIFQRRYSPAIEDRRIDSFRVESGYMVILETKDLPKLLDLKLIAADATISRACEAFNQAKEKMNARKKCIRQMQTTLAEPKVQPSTEPA